MSLPSSPPSSRCPPPPPFPPLLHFAYRVGGGVVAGSCATCWRCGVVVGSCAACWRRGRLAVGGPCVPCWGGATAGLVRGGLAAWRALRAMLGCRHGGPCTWRVSVVGGSCAQ